MKTINIITQLLFLTIFMGCVDDKTVHDFKALNEVSINGLQDKYSVMLYGYLKPEFSVSTSLNDESDLSYLWYAYTPTSRNEADTLGQTKNLNVLIEPSLLTPGEDYTLVFKVTDKKTGVHYRKEMKLEVTTQFTKGTVLLCEENGEARINFIQDNTEKTVLTNVYTEANKELAGRNPVRIFSVNPNKFAPFLKQELIFCNDANGGMIASPLSFEKIKPIRDAFDVTPATSILCPEFYYKSSQIDYIIVNGIVHRRGINMKAINWEPGLVLINEQAEYSAAPDALAIVSGKPIFFDQLHNRLIYHGTWNKGSLSTLPKDESDPGHFDCDRLGENLKLKCWGTLSEPKMAGWMLLEDVEEHKHYLYKFSFLDAKFKSLSKIEIKDIVAPNLKNAIGFGANDKYKDVFMYATEDGVYSFAANQLTTATASSLEVLQKDMKQEKMKVTGIKFTDITVAAPTDQNPAATKISQQIRLAVQDLVLTEKRGGVVFYEVNSTGGTHLEFLFKKTGFCEKVIDIDEKYN